MVYTCSNCHGPVTKSGTGLGTWHCVRGCQKRVVSVERFVGAGKEADSVGSKRRMESVRVVRNIKVARRAEA
jgi:hypothetical protein